MTDELKPCMCGGTAKYDIITRYDTGAYGSGSRYFEYRVICEKCGIRTKTYDESEKLIPITVWNNRVEPDTNRCRQGCPNKAYMDHEWVCDAIDWAEDNEPGFVVQKFRILDTKQPTPEWCPLEEK